VTSRERLVAILGGAGAGAFGGLFGVGGGVLLIPVMTGLLKRTQHEAHGTSLAVIAATAVAGLVVYGAYSRVEWTTAVVAGLASLVTARFGARTAARMPSRELKLAFAAVLIALAIRLLWKAGTGGAPLAGLAGPARIGFDLALGAAVGFIAGLLGVGGGVLAVPAFTLLLGMSQHQAQGTSLALILFAAPAGAIEHARHGNVVGKIAVWLAAGALVGGLVASKLVQTAPGPLLTRGFALFLIANAIPIAFRALRQPKTAPVVRQ